MSLLVTPIKRSKWDRAVGYGKQWSSWTWTACLLVMICLLTRYIWDGNVVAFGSWGACSPDHVSVTPRAFVQGGWLSLGFPSSCSVSNGFKIWDNYNNVVVDHGHCLWLHCIFWVPSLGHEAASLVSTSSKKILKNKIKLHWKTG
jgi:hypothetical protein